MLRLLYPSLPPRPLEKNDLLAEISAAAPPAGVATAAGARLASQTAPGVEAGRAAGGQGSGQRRRRQQEEGEQEEEAAAAAEEEEEEAAAEEEEVQQQEPEERAPRRLAAAAEGDATVHLYEAMSRELLTPKV